MTKEKNNLGEQILNESKRQESSREAKVRQELNEGIEAERIAQEEGKKDTGKVITLHPPKETSEETSEEK